MFQESGIKVYSDYNKKEGYDLSLITYLDKFIHDYDIIHTHDLNPMMYISPLKIYNILI